MKEKNRLKALAKENARLKDQVLFLTGKKEALGRQNRQLLKIQKMHEEQQARKDAEFVSLHLLLKYLYRVVTEGEPMLIDTRELKSLENYEVKYQYADGMITMVHEEEEDGLQGPDGRTED